jgi:hypothetical protein
MREVTYYRWSAALPVLIPLVAHWVYRDNPAIGLFDRVTMLLYLSGIAWPAYIPFAAALFWWLRRQPVARYRRVSWIAPILFLPPFLFYLLVVRWWTGSREPWAGVLVFYSVVVLLFGYGYVLLTHVGRRALGWRGRDGNERAAI